MTYNVFSGTLNLTQSIKSKSLLCGRMGSESERKELDHNYCQTSSAASDLY